jgi:hypothetical protein
MIEQAGTVSAVVAGTCNVQHEDCYKVQHEDSTVRSQECSKLEINFHRGVVILQA